MIDDLDQYLAERRGRRENRQLPKRYRDILPDRPAALPPAQRSPSRSPHPEPSTSSQPIPAQVRNVLKSTRDLFGLFRQYYATRFPEHDPDENLTSDDFADISSDTPSSLPVNSYYPYPTQSSFLLGEWYWNDGVQKSQSSFQDLLKIVGHPDFRPEDVARVDWRRINVQLGGESRGDGSNDGVSEDGWEDERVEGDWISIPIKIKVPFHKRTLHPGQPYCSKLAELTRLSSLKSYNYHVCGRPPGRRARQCSFIRSQEKAVSHCWHALMFQPLSTS